MAVNAGLAITTVGRSALTLGMPTLTGAEDFSPASDLVLSSGRTPRERPAAVKALVGHMVASFHYELHDSHVNKKN